MLGLFRFPYIQLSFVATATHALSGGTGILVGNRMDCNTGKYAKNKQLIVAAPGVLLVFDVAKQNDPFTHFGANETI